MFNRVRERTDWPIDTGDCLWGYFFHATDLSKLTSAGRLLEAQGYRVAAILSDEDDPERAPSDPAPHDLQMLRSVKVTPTKASAVRQYARSSRVAVRVHIQRTVSPGLGLVNSVIGELVKVIDDRFWHSSHTLVDHQHGPN
jgi:hypothetical protein